MLAAKLSVALGMVVHDHAGRSAANPALGFEVGMELGHMSHHGIEVG